MTFPSARRRVLRAVLVGAGMLVGAVGVSYATTLATAQSTEVTVIQACQGTSGLLRVVSAAADCRNSETPISCETSYTP